MTVCSFRNYHRQSVERPTRVSTLEHGACRYTARWSWWWCWWWRVTTPQSPLAHALIVPSRVLEFRAAGAEGEERYQHSLKECCCCREVGGGVATVWAPEPRHVEAILSVLYSSYLPLTRRRVKRRMKSSWETPPKDATVFVINGTYSDLHAHTSYVIIMLSHMFDCWFNSLHKYFYKCNRFPPRNRHPAFKLIKHVQ